MYSIVCESALDKAESKIYKDWECKGSMNCPKLTCDVVMPKPSTSFGILDCNRFHKGDIVG